MTQEQKIILNSHGLPADHGAIYLAPLVASQLHTLLTDSAHACVETTVLVSAKSLAQVMNIASESSSTAS
jgi:hypothetical protein